MKQMWTMQLMMPAIDAGRRKLMMQLKKIGDVTRALMLMMLTVNVVVVSQWMLDCLPFATSLKVLLACGYHLIVCVCVCVCVYWLL